MLLTRWMNNCYLVTYVADTLDEQLLSRNIDRELEPELDSNLKLRNASQNLSMYNMKYMEQTENSKQWK